MEHIEAMWVPGGTLPERKMDKTPELHIQKNSERLYISLNAVTDTSLTYNPKDNTFWLQFEGSDEVVTVTLTPEALQTLALKSIVRLPELDTPHRVATDTEAIRQPARMLLRYDDRSIQLILREIQSDTLLAFLWFMKDAVLLKRVLANMSRRAAEMLMDDLQQDWAGKDPDDAGQVLALKSGIEAVTNMLAICHRMTEEGQLPEVTIKPEPILGECELTVKEVDALLTGVGTDQKADKP